MWGEVRLTHEVIWRWMNLLPFVGIHFCRCGGTVWSFITLSFFPCPSPPPLTHHSSPSTHHRCPCSAVRQPYLCVCLYVCLFFKRGSCLLVYVLFALVLQGHWQNRLKARCSLGKEQKKREQNNSLSVRRIDSLVIHRYTLQQFLFSFGAWIIGWVLFRVIRTLEVSCPQFKRWCVLL